MDRIAPTRRPGGRVQGYQRWRDLLFLHWPVAVDDLRPLIPDALDIDVFEDQAYVGLVAFAMYGVRPAWLPEWLAFDFLETNVRTYVHAAGDDPGVYFFSLDAASWLAVKAARLGWGLPYFYARMSMNTIGQTKHSRADNRTVDVATGTVIDYQTTRRPESARTRVRYRVGAELGDSRPDTLEYFLFERYLLHVERRSSIYTGQVYHAPYPIWLAEVEQCSDELVAAAGLPRPLGDPPLVHYSPGVDVEIFPLRRRIDPNG
ncbi:MAG: DUF2071 domain-containing protein [Proteobacteria bacterium]|nr:DUF2071 domain-containing protein [Pseudomonadota bacterium]